MRARKAFKLALLLTMTCPVPFNTGCLPIFGALGGCLQMVGPILQGVASIVGAANAGGARTPPNTIPSSPPPATTTAAPPASSGVNTSAANPNPGATTPSTTPFKQAPENLPLNKGN